MRVSVFIATSLDGFIARTNGDLDWLPEAPEDHGYDEFMATVDTIVMGRHTYEKVLTFGAWPFTKPVVVLTSRPMTPPPDGAAVTAMHGTPSEIVAALAATGVQSIYLDGGVTVQRFLEAGLLDRLIITRIPVLLGAGIPLFGALSRDVRLRHVRTESWPSGLVQSEYLRDTEGAR